MIARDRTQFEKEWVDGPALQLALVPPAERGERVVALVGEIGAWIAAEFPDLDAAQVLGATRSYSAAIISRALEISRASSGAVGRA